MLTWTMPTAADHPVGLGHPPREDVPAGCDCAFCQVTALPRWSLHDTRTTSETLIGFSSDKEYAANPNFHRFVGSEHYLLQLPSYPPDADELAVRVIDHEHKLEVTEIRERHARKLRARTGAHYAQLVGQMGQVLVDWLPVHELDQLAARSSCQVCDRTLPPDGGACVYCGWEPAL